MRDSIGGVAYMNHQIMEYGKFMDHSRVRVILVKREDDETPRFSEKFKAHEVVLFNYSAFDNKYRMLKKISKVINQREGVIVVNDGIELQAIQLFGTKSLVYSIVHDFYCLKFAFTYYTLIDVFICHTDIYTRTLKSSWLDYPRVDYLPHGVQINNYVARETNEEKLKIVFIGRLEESKGTLVLFNIDSMLKAQGIEVEWKIIGNGSLAQALKEQWKNEKNVSFFSPSKNEEVMEIAKTCDLFIAPSIFEGYGIALLEAMSCSLVPLVYELPVGISSILPVDVGFKFSINDIQGFVDTIKLLNADRMILTQMKGNAYQFVAKDYNISETSKNYMQSLLFDRASLPSIKSGKPGKKIKQFTLVDKWFLPNLVTVQFKKIKNRITNK